MTVMKVRTYKEQIEENLKGDNLLLATFGAGIMVASIWWLWGIGSTAPYLMERGERPEVAFVASTLAFLAAMAVWLLRDMGYSWPALSSLVAVPVERHSKSILKRDIILGLAVGGFCYVYAWIMAEGLGFGVPEAGISPDNLYEVFGRSLRAGVGEEITYRWLLVGGMYLVLAPLFKTRWLLVVALGLLSVGLFELAHLRTLENTLIMMPTGVLYFVAYWFTDRRIIAPIAAHTLYDVLAFGMPLVW